MLPKITGSELKDWAEWLKEENCGCCRKYLLTDDDDNDWYILMGWSDGYDESDNGKWQSGTFKINTKIGYQPSNSLMQTDLDIDFNCPYDKETDEVDDTNWTLSEEPDWDKLANELNDVAKRVINRWAYFEGVEEEIA